MKALVIHGKQDLRQETRDVPEAGPGQVRVRVHLSGICGSDLHYYHQGAVGAFVIREPLVPGHELVCTIDQDPSGTWAIGQTVSVHPATYGDTQPGIETRPNIWPNGAYLGSAATWPHTQGGMCEYLVLERSMVRPLPDGMPMRRAALAEPLAVGLHALHEAGGVKGQRVLVCGAGPIGLLAAAAAVIQGADVTITDILAEPLSRAEALGVQHTVRIGHQALAEEAFDVVIECTGVPASIDAGLVAIRRAGVMVQVGMIGGGAREFSLAPLIAKEIQWRGSFRFTDEIDEAIDLLAADDRFDQVITHVLPADDAIQAFDVAHDPAQSAKVLISLWS